MNNKEKQCGMIMSIFRDAAGGDYSNNGVSSQVTQIVVFGEGLPEIFEPSESMPLMKMITKYKGHPVLENLQIVPVDDNNNIVKNRVMFGGNFAYSCDSRTPKLPVKIHDRVEY